MGFISILIALFGGYILWYGLELPPVIAGQYMWLGLAMMLGGLFLYVYSKKK
jgi:LPXTG-motif cell wall-anchored protein